MAKMETELRRLRSIGMEGVGRRIWDLFPKHRPEPVLEAIVELVLGGAKNRGRIEPKSKIQEAAFPIIRELEQVFLEQPPMSDLMGPLYTLLGCGKSGLGQFFTPASLCDATAEMTMHDLEPKGDRPIRIGDPCVGPGGMLLAAGRFALRRGGPELLSHLSFTGIDLDPLLARIAAVQFIAADALHRAMPAEIVIVHGNGLEPIANGRLIIWAEHPRWLPKSPAPPPPKLPELGEAPPPEIILRTPPALEAPAGEV